MGPGIGTRALELFFFLFSHCKSLFPVETPVSERSAGHVPSPASTIELACASSTNAMSQILSFTLFPLPVERRVSRMES